MGLTKLGKYLELSDWRNGTERFGQDAVVGLSTQKQMITTKADLTRVDLKGYKVFPPGFFAYVSDTSRRGDKVSLAYNSTMKTYLVSSISIVFRVVDIKNLLSDYLFIYFNRPEFDRYARFNSWGSVRETFSWEDMCDIDIELPSIEIQQKYVDIYNAMLANQQSYERGLEDLKLVCDGYIEDLRRKIPQKRLKEYLVCTDRKSNNINLEIRGISNKKKLSSPNSRVEGVDKSKYLLIDYNEFAYSPIHINDGAITLNYDKCSYLISPIYKTFKSIDEQRLCSQYLMLWFQRDEFIRYTWFHAFGSARDNFEWKDMCEYSIPIPSIETQKSIANIYKAYIERKGINERLKAQIKDICPILIKGSLEEAEKEVTAV